MISIYRNIQDTASQFTTTVDDALERIKKGRSLKKITDIRNETNKDRLRILKDSLPSITFSGVFSTREDANLISHSGFICMDFDKVDVEKCKEYFKKWKYTYACWLSPTATGIKVLVKIANGSKHREHYAALKKEFPNLDPKCVNESRVCYESYDPEIFINRESEVYTSCIKTEVIEVKNVNTDTYDIYKKLIKWCESEPLNGKSDKRFYMGNRNFFVYSMAGAMCRYGIDMETAKGLLIQDYSQSDFTSKEIGKSVWSAYKKNGNKYGSVEFSNDKLYEKETKYEISPDIFDEEFQLQDVIYGRDVYEGALDIFKNGYRTAESTHIPKLDEFFKWKKGELTAMTGIGNYGKSSYSYQLTLIKTYFDNTKWAIFSPEHSPPEEFYHDLTEILLGCRCDGGAMFKPSEETYKAAYDFISEHFFYVFPESIAPSPEYIKTKFLELILKEKVEGVIIDPFNQLANDYKKTAGRSDKYLETFLSDCAFFAKTNDVYFLIISHPTKLEKMVNGNYPCPDIFDIADGAMWNNKCDNILVYHRPLAQTDPDAPICEHHSKKIRRQKMIGKRGSFEFELNRKKRRFYFDGANPLDGNRFEKGIPSEINSMELTDENPF